MRNVLIGLTGVLCTACAANPGRDASPSTFRPPPAIGTLVSDEGPPPPPTPQTPSGDYCLDANGRNVFGRWICRAVDHPTFWRWAMTAGFTAIGFAIYHSIRAPGGCHIASTTVVHGTDPITGQPTTSVQENCQ